jgi:S-DNA-T family DNA segregation ATPase FtsK/SpoIIIE
MSLKKERGYSQENSIKHPELKGLIILSFCLATMIALISFVQDHPSHNYLGLLGYYYALGLLWSCGLGAYLVTFYIAWIGWRLLYSEKSSFVCVKSLYFSLFVLSSCVLMTIYSDAQGLANPILQQHIFSQTISFKIPFVHKITRYNLGGVPLYFIYKDIPIYNMKNLLSHTGASFTFAIMLLISFMLLTGISLHATLKKFSLLIFSFKAFAKRVIVGFKPFSLNDKDDYLSYAKIEQALSKPSRHAPPLWTPSVPTLSKDNLAFTTPSLKEEQAFEEEASEEEFTENDTPSPIFEEAISLDKYPILEKQDPKKSYSLSLPSLPTIKKHPSYKLPSSSLLTNAKKIDKPTLKRDLRKQAEILEETLASFGIEAKVGEINCGPTITSFEVHPAIGVKVQKIKALENDIALNLQAKSIRIIAPIPGKAVVGVEIPSLYPQEVGFKEMLCAYQKQRRKFTIPVLLGKTVSGEDVTCDLTKMPHCIIAGATGSGKSVCINTLVMSILMNNSPDDIKLLLIDPKKVELSAYSTLPHMLAPVITEPHGAYAALQWLVKEMQLRYEILKMLGFRNITAFNERSPDRKTEDNLGIVVPDKMFYIVTIIDEFADLIMTSSTDLETPIARIAQMARAVGIHLILATQRPSREVITGLIKANFPTRIAFKVSSRINSQIILDENGAETLLGNGDLLFMPPGSTQLNRAQGAYICDADINKIIDYNCKQAPANYLIKSFDEMSKEDFGGSQEESEAKDSLYDKALAIVVSSRTASTTFLQRKLKIGYARAASLMDELEENKIIGPQDGSKPRKILINSLDTFSFTQDARF